MKTAYTFKIGGEAGFGVMSVGQIFSKLATRSGYYTFDYSEYPSLIRGGHNVMQVCVKDEPIYSQYKHTDLLLALNQETIDLHKTELNSGGVIVYDSDAKISPLEVPDGVECVGLPFVKVIQDIKGSLVMRNNVGLGAVCALANADLETLFALVNENFGDKRSEIAELNEKACYAGHELITKNYHHLIKPVLKKKSSIVPQIVITGNEAVALGAISAGLQFLSVYPMTPTSNIMAFLAGLQEKFGFIYKQPEDEISAINMAIGASYAGARTMVATSGGGFCLMSEGYGLAGITETPLVIIEGQRGAPATGLPTWTEQGDLRFVLHAHHGEFPRIILAPGDVNEAFDMTFEAFNLADKYQTPVVVLIDKYLCESHMSVPPFNTIGGYVIDTGRVVSNFSEDYKRFIDSRDGISPRSFPGLGNFYVTNSDEHDEFGLSTESADIRITQMNKRMRKLETCQKEDMTEPTLYGPESADLTIISWGSNKGPILEAINMVNFTNLEDPKDGKLKVTLYEDKSSKPIRVNYLHFNWINPLPTEKLLKILQKSKNTLIVECNYSGQFAGLLEEKTGFKLTNRLLRYDGRPFYPEDINKQIRLICS